MALAQDPGDSPHLHGRSIQKEEEWCLSQKCDCFAEMSWNVQYFWISPLLFSLGGLGVPFLRAVLRNTVPESGRRKDFFSGGM